MKEGLGLRILSEIMGWDDARAGEEFRWLSLMARLKYDGYQDFLAGVRFIESLATWLQQFPAERRGDAYAFVRHVLVYIGPAEMLRLVEAFYPDHVQRRLMRVVAGAHRAPTHLVWSDAAMAAAYDTLLRRTVFVGLSEGARLDLVRRANAGVISNEQVLLATYVDGEKWDKLLDDLRADLGDPAATFRVVYLIDDFVGSGTTFLRQDKQGGRWKGKLAAFYQSVGSRLTSHFDPALTICVHHYLANHPAVAVLEERQRFALAEKGPDAWFADVDFSFGAVLPSTLPIDCSADAAARAFVELARTYFDAEDPTLKNKHIEEGGTDAALGFSGCALPLVLEHNTPNNSVALLWADTPGAPAADGRPARHAMRPLFRRRQRHG